MSWAVVGNFVGRLVLLLVVKIPLMAILLFPGNLAAGGGLGWLSFTLLRSWQGSYTGSTVVAATMLGLNILVAAGTFVGVVVGHHKLVDKLSDEYLNWHDFFDWLESF